MRGTSATSVDLPLPERPTMATVLPAGTRERHRMQHTALLGRVFETHVAELHGASDASERAAGFEIFRRRVEHLEHAGAGGDALRERHEASPSSRLQRLRGS